MTAPAPVASHGAYSHVEGLLAQQRCVILDGGTATELPEVAQDRPELDERLWGTSALVHTPQDVLDVHRRYVGLGCDVLSTNTWGLPSVLRAGGPQLWASSPPVHWLDIARRGLRLARQAVDEAGRTESCAVAFSLNGDIDAPEGLETIRLLGRLFEHDAPDLILLETLSLVRDSTYGTVDALLAMDLPVWVSFRRCRAGVCGVFGQHWGGPEGDAFGRAARHLEEQGVSALLINCVPPDHVTGMLPWLRDFTDLPLGVYPNLGYFSNAGWRSDAAVGPAEYAQLALRWRAEGAAIIGGCCGVGPEHVAAARAVLADTRPGHARPTADEVAVEDLDPSVPPPFTDGHGLELFPLPFPDMLCEEGVFVPTQGSFLVWRHLFREGIGRDLRCLDVGCGTGLLTVQLALNGAAHVHAIDLDPRAAANTRTNAFRNGVAERVTAAAEDLYPWVPEESYDLIVASLYQTPVDPFELVASHRPLDYWGRNLVDHLIRRLPLALAPGGVAYLMQLSVLGQRRTAHLLETAGLACRVADFAFFEFHDLFRDGQGQIERVEGLSDAYHLKLGGTDIMVAYLLEITRFLEITRPQAADLPDGTGKTHPTAGDGRAWRV
ncbi:MAG: homocysteine S-methyltransferase family protein [Solirubrobacterales bacterium]|nr:homocysteine S-methyltransferase family protein [Solirubrobacterales bacterium]